MKYQLKKPALITIQPPADFQKDAINELIGLCYGLLVDGKITMDEAAFFRDWITKSHPELLDTWVFQPFQKKLAHMFRDSYIARSSLAELSEIAFLITGRTPPTKPEETSIPFDEPPPCDLVFESRFFCLTGGFEYGREQAAEKISELGGLLQSAPTSYSDYVIVGNIPDPLGNMAHLARM